MNKSTIIKILTLYIYPFSVLLFIGIICLLMKIPVQVFMQDPFDTAKIYPYVGFVSNCGIFVWCACTSVCFFTHGVLCQKGLAKEYHWFVFWGGIITAVLMIDDAFMLHESVYVKCLGIDERITISVYVIATITYFIKYARLILKTEYLYLVFAIMFFVFSVMADVLHLFQIGDWQSYFEDGLKLFGIVSWAGYYFTVCGNLLIGQKSRRSEPASSP